MALLLLGCNALASAPASAAPASQTAVPALALPSHDEWSRIGGFGQAIVQHLEVSPRWPEDPVIVATVVDQSPGGITRDTPRRLMVTLDGGKNWRPGPPRRTAGGAYTPHVPGRGVAFVEESLPIERSSDRNFVLWRLAGDRDWREIFPAAQVLKFSPRFADDGVVFVSANGQLFRSADWGASWALVLEADASRHFASLVLPDALYQQGIVLAVGQSGRVYRSIDRGVSWREAFGGGAGIQRFSITTDVFGDTALYAEGDLGGIRLQSLDRGATWHEPSVPVRFIERPRGPIVDGIMFTSSDDALYPYRSTDAGASWQMMRLPVGPDHGTSYPTFWSLRFSPDFAVDRTLVAYFRNENGAVQGRATAPSGFISRDGGTTWSVLAPTFEIEGNPYGSIEAVEFSPNFSRDGVLIALAMGPEIRGGFCEELAVPGFLARSFIAVFRSADRGQTWQPVVDEADLCARSSTGSLPSLPNLRGFGSGSPGGLGVITWSRSGSRSDPGGCFALQTVDGGVTWNPSRVGDGSCVLQRGWAPTPAGSTTAALGAALLRPTTATSGELVQLSRGIPKTGWSPWVAVRAPGDFGNAASWVTLSPAFERDAMLLVGTQLGEVWTVKLCAC